MKNKFSIALSLAVIVAMLVTSLALADQINADADAFVLSTPNGNNVTATQDSGTTVSYDFSAVIRNTGNSSNDVFATDGDSVSVAIAKNGSWVSGGTSGPWTFSAYELPQAGTVEIAIPCDSQGTTATMTVILTATASNGKNLSPDSRTLSYVITAGPNDPSCTPPDTTAPTANPSIAGTQGTNGWYTSDVNVTWNWSDNAGGSGIDTNNCTMSSTSSGEGMLTVNADCHDLAGNKGTASVSVKVDKTAPGITFVGPSTSAWYNANVTANWSCSDVTSGPVSNTVSAVANGEGNAVAATGTCVDNAGNSVSDTQYFMIDKTAPVVAVTGVVNGAQYTLGAVPTAGCSTTDGLSGVATYASLSTSGGPVGFITAACSGAFDNAGNAGNTATATYQVVYAWNGFFQPVDNFILNGAKAGQSIPLKWRLTDANGAPVLNLTSVSVKVGVFACAAGTPTDAIEEYAAGSSGLQNLGDGNYQFNWKTLSTYANSCRSMTLDLGDGVLHTVQFQFKK